jgi:RNA polymerase sigma factor (sigma-70 family)
MSDPDGRHRVVVLGGGFGGLQAARSLRRAPVQVTLVDRRNFHLFQPLLYQVATGALSPAETATPLRVILKRQKSARVVMGEVRAFDLDRRCLTLDALENGDNGLVIPYETLIVAGGSRYSCFGHDEWRPFALEPFDTRLQRADHRQDGIGTLRPELIDLLSSHACKIRCITQDPCSGPRDPLNVYNEPHSTLREDRNGSSCRCSRAAANRCGRGGPPVEPRSRDWPSDSRSVTLRATALASACSPATGRGFRRRSMSAVAASPTRRALPVVWRLDGESRAWWARLHGAERVRDCAIVELQERLRREAWFHIRLRTRGMADFPASDLEDLAVMAANDALLAILRKLEDYRGESQFWTWARRFAQLEAPVSIRRRMGHDHVADDPERAFAMADHGCSPQERAEVQELLRRVSGLIVGRLTARQRTVLVAIAIDGVSTAALAIELDTTPGAIYKTLHDARKKLTTGLALP